MGQSPKSHGSLQLSIFVGELNEKSSGHMMLAIFEGESYLMIKFTRELKWEFF